MPSLQVGQSAPRFTLPRVDGQLLRLDDVLQTGQHTLLVFLRHLG